MYKYSDLKRFLAFNGLPYSPAYPWYFPFYDPSDPSMLFHYRMERLRCRYGKERVWACDEWKDGGAVKQINEKLQQTLKGSEADCDLDCRLCSYYDYRHEYLPCLDRRNVTLLDEPGYIDLCD